MKLGRYIIGLISGLTFGMLFAPKKGKKLRDELFKKGSESKQDALMALFHAFKDAGMDAVDEMKKLSDSEQLQSALSMSKEKMREYLSELEESGYDIASRAQEKAEEISDMAVAAGAEFRKRAVKKQTAIKKAVKARVKKTASKRKTTTRKKAASKKK
ncbi:MAG: YtxH domain-containing protein [Patescibacteria group bacterium]